MMMSIEKWRINQECSLCHSCIASSDFPGDAREDEHANNGMAGAIEV